ncbi:MAG TPA: APC family permease [Candidatus Dormibacteraeota bacterium]|nr:APC family permease [Candidatus Dormibacteraeota bacterium]
MEKEASRTAAPRLRRALTLWDLILYGAIVLQPVAPMSAFGALSDRGHGHVVSAVLIAMVAMLCTAFSYGRMAQLYPSAGSAFTYVAREIHSSAGFITGWSMVMDYIVNPLICTIWCAEQAHEFAPGIPVGGWKIFFAVVFTLLNLQGIKTSAQVNAGLAAAMSAVVVVVFITAIRYILGHPHSDAGFFARPFYDPQTFSLDNLFGCTSLAVLTYIGFDAISTLSEEAENPKSDILLATVVTCVIIGFLSAAEVYIAQLVWPASQPFPNQDTAYVYAAARTWAPLFRIVGFTLLVANFGSGMGAQIGAARLLYGMGRSNALPRSFFGEVDPKHHIPRNNVIFTGMIVLVGSFFLTYGRGIELLNFGALIAFMGVNASAFMRYYVRAPEKKILNFISPLAGFFICGGLWWNLSRPAKIVGSMWMIAGILFGVWKTRGFREELSFEVPPE